MELGLTNLAPDSLRVSDSLMLAMVHLSEGFRRFKCREQAYRLRVRSDKLKVNPIQHKCPRVFEESASTVDWFTTAQPRPR